MVLTWWNILINFRKIYIFFRKSSDGVGPNWQKICPLQILSKKLHGKGNHNITQSKMFLYFLIANVVKGCFVVTINMKYVFTGLSSDVSDVTESKKGQAWTIVLVIGIVVGVLALGAFIFLNRRNRRDFSHRKLVEEMSPDPGNINSPVIICITLNQDPCDYMWGLLWT